MFNMTVQKKNSKVQRKSGKTISSKSLKEEETLKHIRENVLPNIRPPCSKRGIMFFPQEWSEDIGVPENTLKGASQKSLHRDAKREGSRRNTLSLQRQGLLTPRTSLRDVLGEEP